MFQYPLGDLDDDDKVLSYLGTHWAQVYAGRDLVRRYVLSRLVANKQSAQARKETILGASRAGVPLRQVQRWYPITLREAERNSVVVSVLRYGDDAVYGNQADGRQYFYGEAVPLAVSAFPLPSAALTGGYTISATLSNPARVLTSGPDFYVDGVALVFRENPFEIAEFAEHVTTIDGSRELQLFLFGAEFDNKQVYKQHGYAFGVYEPKSSAEYRDLLLEISRGGIVGPSRRTLDGVLSAVTGVPLTRTDGETVEDIFEDRDALHVCTDTDVYSFPAGSTAIVDIGDSLLAGQPLVDTLQIVEPNDGVLPDFVNVLVLDRELLGADYLGGLSFRNTVVAPTISTLDGKTVFQFEIRGWPGDVELFWDTLHAKGIAAGATLANLLDTRTNKTGEPQAAALPSTINPAEFLTQNVLRNNCTLAKIRASKLPDTALSLRRLNSLREITPPHTLCMLIVELDAPAESIIMESAGTASRAGYSESAEGFAMIETSGDSVSVSLVSESPRLRNVSGICI